MPGSRQHHRNRKNRDVINRRRIRELFTNVFPIVALCALLGTQASYMQANLLALGKTPEQKVTLESKNTATSVSVKVQNGSADIWYRDTAHEHAVTLVPTRPANRVSALYDPATWIDAKHIALQEESVAPGQTATFTFGLRSTVNDAYREYFAVAKKDGSVYPQSESVIIAIMRGMPRSDILSFATWSTSVTRLSELTGSASLRTASNTTVPYQYELLSVPSPITIQKNETKLVQIRVKNTGSVIWYRDATVGDHPVRLGTARSFDRKSRFYDSASWLSAGRIVLKEPYVFPGETGTFSFSLRAPDKEEAYREYFSLVVEGTGWLDELQPIVIDIAVGTGVLEDVATLERSQSAHPERVIKVDLTTQSMQTFEDGSFLKQYQISSGIWNLPTPTGTFTIHNHARTAYSRRYNLYMDYWQAFTPDGGYGIHSLPYWKLKNGGILYEGADHLGKAVSHGCIRLSPEHAAELYAWTEDKKTKVEISGTTPRLH